MIKDVKFFKYNFYANIFIINKLIILILIIKESCNSKFIMNKISKKFSMLSLLLLLNNCAAPGTALLSPVITGAKTKSAHQASISLASSISSNQILRHHGDKIKSEISERSKKIFNYLNYFHKNKI